MSRKRSESARDASTGAGRKVDGSGERLSYGQIATTLGTKMFAILSASRPIGIFLELASLNKLKI